MNVLFYIDKAKQCANFRHTLLSTKRQTDNYKERVNSTWLDLNQTGQLIKVLFSEYNIAFFYY